MNDTESTSSSNFQKTGLEPLSFNSFFFFFLPVQGLGCGTRIFICSIWTLTRSMWDSPWPGIEPQPPALGVQSLSHRTTREVLVISFLIATWGNHLLSDHYNHPLVSAKTGFRTPADPEMHTCSSPVRSCSLEGLTLKLKLQYFGHLMRRVDSLEKTLMLGGIGGRRSPTHPPG